MSECTIAQQKKCEQICLVGPDGGHQCSCHSGFTVGKDGSCIDVNECETKNVPCSYFAPKCVNTEGSYFCKADEVCPRDEADRYKKPGCCANQGEAFDERCGMPQGGAKEWSFTFQRYQILLANVLILARPR